MDKNIVLAHVYKQILNFGILCSYVMHTHGTHQTNINDINYTANISNLFDVQLYTLLCDINNLKLFIICDR